MAAYAGAANAVAVAVGSNPGANPGIEIFGHLRALVQGMVYETYLQKENKDVTLKTEWDIGDSFIQTTGAQLHVKCREYFAEAETDVSQRDWSVGLYQKGYTMEAPAPEFVTGVAVSAAGMAYAEYHGKIVSVAVSKDVIFACDFYTAILGTTKRTHTDEDIRMRKQKYLFGIHSRSRTNFS